MTLVDRMQELLEAERAGVKCLDVMADQASDMGKKELFTLFRNDEGKFCAGLFGFLQARGAVPTTNVGAFADKVIALPTEAERVALLIKGQRGSSARSTRSPPGRRTPGRRRSSPTCGKCTSSISKSAGNSYRSGRKR